MNNLHKWLKDQRIHSGKTQADVANAAKISRTAYTNIENGKRNPEVNTAKKIAEVLDFDWTLFYEQQSVQNVS
ncbi:MAG: helix-turn-helix family protein [Clostridia bacterium]|nr:helix-turn-helix family protein [Clostridia bacterium]